MKLALPILCALMLSGCAMRVGMQPTIRISRDSYPPAVGPRRVFCMPCFEFDGFGAGIMFFGGWPIFFYEE